MGRGVPSSFVSLIATAAAAKATHAGRATIIEHINSSLSVTVSAEWSIGAAETRLRDGGVLFRRVEFEQ